MASRFRQNQPRLAAIYQQEGTGLPPSSLHSDRFKISSDLDKQSIIRLNLTVILQGPVNPGDVAL